VSAPWPWARFSLCHNIGGCATFAAAIPPQTKKGPLTPAFSINNLSVNNLRSFSRAAK
jgi:hypothetical protein